MSGNELIKNEEIQSRIYAVRGVQVMLDKDLAIFYGVKPIRLREQVKRNIKRFPADFMFQLTKEEAELMVSQNAIPSKQSLGGSMPYVFTEQGVAGYFFSAYQRESDCSQYSDHEGLCSHAQVHCL
jgi:hypothetical protein